ncbi:hypothetical protein [Phosphitispora sp. TUW77]|uniref:hypothetical protein n=1 Tax=Phosphitispora sp. TUW77 TaxID=3152361 RepID=UPI003AB4F442
MTFAKSVILFIILVITWVLIVFNRKLKKQVQDNARSFNMMRKSTGWGNKPCECGNPRLKWHVLSMLRPENTVLLKCPVCGGLWEEQMSVYGNKWRKIDSDYAKDQYNYTSETDSGRNMKM